MFRGALIGSQQINRRLLELGPVTGIDFWQQQRELPHGLFIFNPTHSRWVLDTHKVLVCGQKEAGDT